MTEPSPAITRSGFVTLAGRPNVGKSTLLNALVGSEVARAEDKLFATLDPTSRQVKLGDGQTAIVTDTVGFIHKLPHQLVDAFRATLDLFQTGVEVMRQNLRRRHPAATDEQVARLLQDWLRNRPGAESGDSAGWPVDLTTRRA